MMEYIRQKEWVNDGADHAWFNSYYDNHGNRVEGKYDNNVRMMLTGQVFAIMSGTADENRYRQSARAQTPICMTRMPEAIV